MDSQPLMGSMVINSPPSPTSWRSYLPVYVISALTCMHSFGVGYNTGIVSGALLPIRLQFDIADTDSLLQGIIVSAALVGALFGALSVSGFAQRFGRSPVLLVNNLIYAFGILLCVFAVNIYMLIAGRVFVGLGVGVASVIVPMLITELSPTQIRGTIGTLNQLFVTVGLALAFTANWALANVTYNWRWQLGLALVPVAIHLAGALAVRIESPRWLCMRGRYTEATAMLRRLRSGADIDDELQQIQQTLNSNAPKATFRDLFARRSLRPLIIGILLNLFQQATGINAIMYYLAKFFTDAGFGVGDANLASIAVGVLNVVMTLISAAIIDKAGRRPLILWGLVGMFACLVPIGVFFQWPDLVSPTTKGWICLALVLIYVMSFAIGMGPIPFLMIAEVFPSETRGLGMSICLGVNWMSNLVISLLFPSLLIWIHTQGVFWGFAGIAILAIVFVITTVPETKGRSVEEIVAQLSGESAPLLSTV